MYMINKLSLFSYARKQAHKDFTFKDGKMPSVVWFVVVQMQYILLFMA